MRPLRDPRLAKRTPAAARLGTKRRCLACGAKYYDLGRKPPTCSRCGAKAEPGQAKAANRPAACEPAPAAPPVAPAARARPVGREWSREQAEAIDKVGRWLKAGEPQVFRLFGYAGVGKTTLARHVAEGAHGETAFAAFTGKAALVMRANGCAGATTIHALIYRASEGAEGAPTFTLNADGPASRAGLIVIDECSMVDAELARDLLSFGKPILVLGDPFQLPPGQGRRLFHRKHARRDADRDPSSGRGQSDHPPVADRPLRRRVEGGRLRRHPHRPPRRDRRGAGARRRPGAGRRQPHAPRLQPADARAQRLSPSRCRLVGDRLVCLRNDRTKGLINGGLWRVEALGGVQKDFVKMTVRSEDEGSAKAVKVAVLKNFFEGTEGELTPLVRRQSDEFDYGYALTVHKAQGSQWDDVMLFDESFAFREHRARWLYTGLTRAAKRLTLVR